MLPWLCPPTFECVCLNMEYHYSKSFGSPAFLLKYGLVWGIIERHTRLSVSMKKGWRTRRFQSATPQLPRVSGSTYFGTSTHYHLYLTLLTLQSLKDFWSSTWKPQALWVSLGLITTWSWFQISNSKLRINIQGPSPHRHRFGDESIAVLYSSAVSIVCRATQSQMVIQPLLECTVFFFCGVQKPFCRVLIPFHRGWSHFKSSPNALLTCGFAQKWWIDCIVFCQFEM